jgi:acetate kinase
VLAVLESFIPLAPLHQPHNLAAIRALLDAAPGLPQVACFDTAFHATQSSVATRYAVPRELEARGVRRYGFHGLSYEYIASVLPDYLGARAGGRVVVAHLGNGASLAALRGQRSVGTSMGFTALEGLVMGTRPGSIDPGVLLYLLQEMKMDATAVADLLYHRCGLLGVSGISHDMRELLASTEVRAAEAVDLFVYRTVTQIGGLVAALEGLDALVFTAGIGEHSGPVRERICQGLAWLGVDFDPAANAHHGPRISREGSPVSVWVIPTNEELMIARHTLQVIGKAGS